MALNNMIWTATNGGRLVYFFLFTMIEVFVSSYTLGKRIFVWSLNYQVSMAVKWFLSLPDLRISLEDVGFFTVQDLQVHWKNDLILIAEEVGLGLEWKLVKSRNMPFKLHVKNLIKRGDTLEAFFTFHLYWRIFPSVTSCALEHNQELKDKVATKITRLHATNGRIVVQLIENARTSKASPKIVLKVKAVEAVFIKATDIFLVNARANKLTCFLKGRGYVHSSRKKGHLVDMTCFRLKLVFPKHLPSLISHRFHGTRVQITRSNLKDVLWSVNRFKTILTGKMGSENRTNPGEEQPQTHPLKIHDNKQISKVTFSIEDLVISVGTDRIPEIAAIKVSLDLTADTWIGKSRYAGAVGVQGMCVNDTRAADPCIIIGNELITASWRCSFTSTHVYKRCLIVNAESNEILTLILRPDGFSVLAALHKNYSFLTANTGHSSLTKLSETVKHVVEEHCPRTQISATLEGINLCLELDVFEQLAIGTLEDIRVQWTRDAENLSLDFTIKEIEVEDRVNNVLAVRMSSTDGIQKRAFHLTVIQEATNERRSVSFQQLYGEIVDLSIRIEEDFLLKLLVFCGITDKNKLWAEEKEETANSESSLLHTSDDGQSPLDQEMSFFFERLEVCDISVVCSLSPNQNLPNELLSLKEQLGVTKGLPPRVENARLDFERFLRTGIYYRSLGGLLRDVKRHYLKEVGRQSAKVLGSLHLLGNVTSLKDNIADGLAELKETGDYIGFARHVRGGVTDSYYKLADSWSAYVNPSATKVTRRAVEEPQVAEPQGDLERNDVCSQPGLISSFTNGLGGWIFSPVDETNELLQFQPDVNTSIDSMVPEDMSSVLCSTPQHDTLCSDNFIQEDDGQSTCTSMSSFTTTPTGWELMPREIQKKLKGQEFLRRLQQSMSEEETEERFVCCLKLRYTDPNDKLNALVTTRNVYFMTVGAPSRKNVVLHVLLNKLYKAQEKNDQGKAIYLELIMRIDGMERLSLPSPNPEDNPLVRCDTLNLATKAANKINKAKNRYGSYGNSCACNVILNTCS